MLPSLPTDEQVEFEDAISRADARAEALHDGQVDHDGTPHIFHVRRVKMMVPERSARVALFHDVIEDGHAAFDDLWRFGLSAAEADAVRLLTRREGQPYRSYVRLIAQSRDEAGQMAQEVKEADMLDNLSRCLRAQDPRYANLIHRYRTNLPVIQMAMVG